MLSLMRKHATSWLIKIILAAIVIVFVLWGVGSWTSQRSNSIATVNGEMITADDYRVAYKRLIEQVRQSFGNNLNDELIKTLQLDKQALNQLIDKLLMRQTASELDMRVSDEELSRSIRAVGAFQTAGVFDPRRYQGVLNRNDLTPEAFEISQRDALLMEKLNNLITGSVKVSDQEAMEWYMWNDAMVNLDFFLLQTDRYSDITVTAENTGFYVDPDGKAWIQPYDTLGTWSPAYEYGYIDDMDIGTPPPMSTGWGYPALFQAAALGYILVPLAGLFLVDRVIPRSETTQATTGRAGLLASRTFLLLACASVIVHVANSQIGLAKPLIMDGLQYDATAISTSNAVGTLLTIPVPLLVGWLSDRLGRKPFIVLIYLSQVIGLLVLISGSFLWEFWIVSTMQAMVGNSIVAGQALITDLFPKETLGTALSLFGATPWIGFVIGFGLSGTAMDALGMTPSLMLGVGLAMIAILLLIPVQRRRPQPQVVG